MQDRNVINSQYYCGRSKPGGPIMVLTTSGYVVAEYYEQSGRARWTRVVLTAQKAGIEQWLTQHFPPPELAESKPRSAPVTRTPQAK